MLDAAERKIVQDVQQFGWHCLGIAADEEGPSFSYTIGLQATFRHPEIIIVGLAPQIAYTVLQTAVGVISVG